MSNMYKDWARDEVYDMALAAYPNMKVRHVLINWNQFYGLVGGVLQEKYIVFRVFYFDRFLT